MPDGALARWYKRLVNKGGTGNITELTRDSGPYRNVRFTGQFYDSGMTGNAVWNLLQHRAARLPDSRGWSDQHGQRPHRRQGLGVLAVSWSVPRSGPLVTRNCVGLLVPELFDVHSLVDLTEPEPALLPAPGIPCGLSPWRRWSPPRSCTHRTSRQSL